MANVKSSRGLRSLPRLQRWVTSVLSRVQPEPGSECLRWIGSINAINEYGQCRVSIFYDGLEIDGKSPVVTGAHRVLYSLIRGPIPPGHHLDHITGCEHRWCVNAYHLKAMPQPENAWLGNRRRWHDDREPMSKSIPTECLQDQPEEPIL